MNPLDEMVRDRVAPVLKEARFTRRRRHFSFEDAHGNTALVGVMPFRLGKNDVECFVGLGVQPRVWADFLASGDRSSGAPLWDDRVVVPGATPPLADVWSFDLDDHQAGEALTRSLAARVPELMHMLDPANMLTYARKLPFPGRKISVRPEIAQAALLAALGPSDELEKRLHALVEDPRDGWADFDRDFVAFIRRWMTAR